MLRCLWLNSAEVAVMSIDLTILLQARLSVLKVWAHSVAIAKWMRKLRCRVNSSHRGNKTTHYVVTVLLFDFMGSRAAPVDILSSVKYSYSLFMSWVLCITAWSLHQSQPAFEALWSVHSCSIEVEQWDNASQSAYIAIVFAYCNFAGGEVWNGA